MDFQSPAHFLTAIEIQKAIKKVTSTSCLGTATGHLMKLQREYGDNRTFGRSKKVKKVEKDKDLQKDIFDLSGNYKTFFHTDYFDREKITILKTEYPKLKDINVEDLYERCNQSGYGDVETQTTVVDEEVKKSRDTKDFDVCDEMLQKVKEVWTDKMADRNVRVEPYKVNVYAPGDFFKPHRDTPEKDLIGTILLASDSLKGLVLNGKHINDQICGFYTNVPHEVEAVDDYRLTIAFKVYAQELSPESPLAFDPKLISNCFVDLPEKFGVLFDFKYNLDGRLNGIDKLVYDYFMSLEDYKLTKLPVVVVAKAKGEFLDDWKNSFSTGVYSFTENDMMAILKGKKIEHEHTDLQFFSIQRPNNPYSLKNQPYIEYTGNESQALDYMSVYLNHAIIVERK